MKIKSISLDHFKKFRGQTFDFTAPETGLAKDLIVLMGNNGSGKSTILQAIAATLGTATQRLAKPEDLAWPGFDFALIGNAWSLPSKVELKVEFSKKEIEATSNYFRKVPDLSSHPDAIEPGQDSEASLKMAKGTVTADNRRQYFQFRGREYAKQVIRIHEAGYNVFNEIGAVFWYTEQRTSTSLTSEGRDGKKDGTPVKLLALDQLRDRLSKFLTIHKIKNEKPNAKLERRDFYQELENAYSAIFPERSFEGSVLREDFEDIMEEPWFFLYDGKKSYEIAEMSGGERAVFPIIFDFASWKINNSVILIDEIELHLHPPMQQALIRSLKNLGKNNQFIITTHSDSIEQIVPEENILRMDEG